MTIIIISTVALIIGFGAGIGVAFLIRIIQLRMTRELATELLKNTQEGQRADRDALMQSVKAEFGALSLEALSKSTDEFMKLAQTRLTQEREVNVRELESKKGVIDQQLTRMTGELEKVGLIMNNLEKDRVQKFGELSQQLKNTGEQTAALTQTTRMLREALVHTKVRGQWGERMAEDVLRVAGFVENINYYKQKTIAESGSRPDYTFVLPRNLMLNMDVKFPLDNYVKFLEAPDADKERFKTDFLRDVRLRMKEITTRDYINNTQNTVDYVLLFIPNEQMFGFIQECDTALLDAALANKVIICSPLTLFGILAVVRQAVDNFSLEKTSNEILSLMGAFKAQWDQFVKKMDLLGKRIEDAHKEYDLLTTTRRRQVEKPLNKIESLRAERNLPIADVNSAEVNQDVLPAVDA